jgi:hypothetical protein
MEEGGEFPINQRDICFAASAGGGNEYSEKPIKIVTSYNQIK